MSSNALSQWMDEEYAIAADALLRAISATGMVCRRQGFGQTIVPAKGAVLAARQIAFYDPDPDYFFHWLRDSTAIVDALRSLLADGATERAAAVRFTDFLRFSLRLGDQRGAALLERGDFRQAVDPAYLQYVRSDADLLQVEGERTLGETRFNPDGTLDIIQWPRPQNDGPALRALTVLRYWRSGTFKDTDAAALMRTLIAGDLAYTVRQRAAPCFDIWEEEVCHPYYTRLVQRAALLAGASWARELGQGENATRYEDAARELAARLDVYWSAQKGHYLSRVSVSGGDPAKLLDSATMLAVVHAGLTCGRHSVLDPRVHATWHKLELLFAAGYPINEDRGTGFGPAFGRYIGDVYYEGGAWYVTTLAFAELYYRLATAVAGGAALHATPENAGFLAACVNADLPQAEPLVLTTAQRDTLFHGLLEKGDAIMRTVQRYTPPTGELSEQFDQHTGVQRSAKHLSWSYAALITAVDARRQACSRNSGEAYGTSPES